MTVSAVDPTVEVPDVRQQTVANAQALLAQVGLRLAQRGTQASVQPAGIVLSQDPVAGLARPDGLRDLVVVSAGGLVVVPQLIGRQQSAAVQLLRSLGLDFSSDVVVNLSRAPGTVVSPGSERGRPGADRLDRGHARRHPPDPSIRATEADHQEARLPAHPCRRDDAVD